MKIWIWQHVPFEGPGALADWAADRDLTLHTGLAGRDPFPTLEPGDRLVVMGGPMNVDEEDRYPWLRDEKVFLQKAIAADHRILGICLGAQLLARVLGAAVRPNGQQEIGWFPVRKVQPHPWTAPCPDPWSVFHGHGDTFAVPSGAVPLFTSEACAQQGFVWGDRLLALQFHPEMTAAGIADLLAHSELGTGPYVQDRATLLAQSGDRTALYTLLDGWWG